MRSNPKIERYYKILNVEESCSDLQLRRAYRRIALMIHPDKSQHGSTKEQFQALNKVYSRLVAWRKKNSQEPSSELVIDRKDVIPLKSSQQLRKDLIIEIENNFNRHIQMLDCIIYQLKHSKNMGCFGSSQQMKVVY